MILERMEGAGLALSITDAGKLKVIGVLCDSQRDYIRSHKDELIIELRSRLPHCVKCINCTRFTRTDHPHLGKCDAGKISSAAAGFWDTHLRGCDQFTEIMVVDK